MSPRVKKCLGALVVVNALAAIAWMPSSNTAVSDAYYCGTVLDPDGNRESVCLTNVYNDCEGCPVVET